MLKFKTKNIPINDIHIPAKFKSGYPRASKISKCYNHYRCTGTIDRAIIINQNNYLLDGYVGYLVAKMFDAEQLRVVQVSEKAKENMQ